MLRWCLCLFVCCSSVAVVRAQADATPRVSLDVKEAALVSVIENLRGQTGYNFLFNASDLQNARPVTLRLRDVTLRVALDSILPSRDLVYTIDGKSVVIKKKAVEVKQVRLVEVSGRVVDEKGDPIPGASVIVYGTQQGVATDINGRYVLQMQPEGVLQFSFVGYKTETIPVKGKDRVNVTLNPTSENIEEVQVVAFGTQKKESVVGSISTIRPMDLKSSSSDLTTQLTGKIAGIIGWQTGGLPGALTEEEMNTKFYIRGISSSSGVSEPLVLIDGVESSRLDLARMAPEDIESFSVLKDASATAMYGARGANGVILVTTKKGEEGSVYTSVRYEAVWSMPTDEIEVVDPKTYMQMYNEALTTRNPNASPAYSLTKIERTGDPRFPSYVYPANDWYDILFKDFSVNHRAGVNVRGGSSIMQYYASVNYVYDSGMLKTDRLNQFDVNIKNSTLSSRVNLNINLNAGIQLLLNTSFSIDKYHGPNGEVNEAYALAFNASPVNFAPTYPADEKYSWPHLRFGNIPGGAESAYTNPYAYIQLGYKDRERYSVTTKAEYIQSLSQLLKGLEIRASVALSKTGYSSTSYTTSPFYYYLDVEGGDYDFETGEHTLTDVTFIPGRRTIEIPLGGSSASTTTQWVYEGRALHTAAWADHQTSLVAVFQAIQSSSAPNSDLFESIEHRNLSFSMRGTYGYKDRYFFEASFGYNGSERFTKNNRMGFFPSVGGAWVVSKENFMQGISNGISFLKLRASWGKVGNDGIIDSPRFVYMPEITSTSVANGVDPEAGNIMNFYRKQIKNYGDPDVKWEVSEQINLGLETRFFKDILEVNVDLYQEIRHNIIENRTVIPASMGIELPPLDIMGKVRARGMDLSAKVQHAFTPDFWIILNGTLTYSRAEYKELDEATDTPWWQSKIGHEISQQVGFVDQGLFRSQAEVDYAPQQNGEYALGDIRYRDINGDGVIDVEDAVHIGFPTTPRITYGFGGFVTYKNLEFSFSFQGSGRRGFFIDPVSISPFVSGRQLLKAIAEDHWTPENMEPRPFWPRLSVNGIDTHNREEYYDNSDYGEGNTYYSTYFMRECRFLRCTGLELAYNLPDTWKRALKMQNVKFFFRANNPFIISNFDLWDVELGGSGFNYPIQRTYAVGLNFSF